MSGHNKISKLEKDKRVRSVMEWILEDWPSDDIVNLIISKWGVTARQGQRYLSDARKRWVNQKDELLEHKRRLKVETLRKMKRSISEDQRKTPYGIRTMLAIEKEITKLEGLYPAQKVQLTGKDEGPIEVKEIPSEIDYSQLPTEVIDVILKARKPVHE